MLLMIFRWDSGGPPPVPIGQVIVDVADFGTIESVLDVANFHHVVVDVAYFNSAQVDP